MNKVILILFLKITSAETVVVSFIISIFLPLN